MSPTFLIAGGTIVTETETYTGDLLINDGRIESIFREENSNSKLGDVLKIDATGKLILPGGVDVHTHFDLPMFNTVSSDDHYSGTKAAAYGGTTTVIDFVPLIQEGENESYSGILAKSVDTWREKAQKSAVDYSFHMNISQLTEEIEAEIPRLVEMGITSVKVFTAYNHRLRLDDGSIFRILRIAGDNGLLVMAHCENGDVIETLTQEALLAGHRSAIWHARTRPAWGAVEATLRMAALAAQAEAPIYIVHMNVSGEVDMLEYARSNGVKVMGETCPQYLFFTEDEYQQKDGIKWVCSPPLRLKKDNERLWQGLKKGIIQTLATDHCPFLFNGRIPINYEGKQDTIPGKELGKGNFTLVPNGLPGVGDRLPILWTYGVGAKRITANHFVQITCSNPARIFGMYPKKGTIQEGSDADLLIWDPGKKLKYGVKVAQHRTDHNLYEGWQIQGFPEKVFLRGDLIVNEGEWLGRRGMGEFIKRNPGADIL